MISLGLPCRTEYLSIYVLVLSCRAVPWRTNYQSCTHLVNILNPSYGLIRFLYFNLIAILTKLYPCRLSLGCTRAWRRWSWTIWPLRSPPPWPPPTPTTRSLLPGHLLIKKRKLQLCTWNFVSLIWSWFFFRPSNMTIDIEERRGHSIEIQANKITS